MVVDALSREQLTGDRTYTHFFGACAVFILQVSRRRYRVLENVGL